MVVDLWDHSVELMIESEDHFRCVSNSREAYECLSTCWPKKSGKWFTLARKSCLKALQGEGDPAEAEAAFIKAAEEAGILRV
jgi:hypothetical protein